MVRSPLFRIAVCLLALLLLMTAMHEKLCRTVDKQAAAPSVS